MYQTFNVHLLAKHNTKSFSIKRFYHVSDKTTRIVCEEVGGNSEKINLVGVTTTFV